MATSFEKLHSLYIKLMSSDPRAELRGKALGYTSMNGHMYSFITKEQDAVALRLPKEEREAFLKKYRTTLVEQYGVVMKEYVRISPRLLAKTRELAAYVTSSVDYIASLKPKPTNRPKQKGKKVGRKTAKKKTAKKKTAKKSKTARKTKTARKKKAARKAKAIRKKTKAGGKKAKAQRKRSTPKRR